MTYLENLRRGCINALKSCRMQFLSFEYIVKRDHFRDSLKHEFVSKGEKYLEEARIFLQKFPTNTPCNLMTIKEFEKTLEDIQQVSETLDYYFDNFHVKSWLSHKEEDIDINYTFNYNTYTFKMPMTMAKRYSQTKVNKKYYKNITVKKKKKLKIKRKAK